MSRVFSALLLCLCVGGFGATSAQAKTFTVIYDIDAVLDAEYFTELYYLDFSDPYGPYAESCHYGEACYPTDWRPNWVVGDSYQMGDVLTARMEAEILESVQSDGSLRYSVRSISGGGGGVYPGFYNSWYSGSFDPATFDFYGAASGYDSQWSFELANGTGTMHYIGEDWGHGGYCYSSTTLINMHPDFCDGSHVEAFFTITGYEVTTLIAAPVPASALFLLTAMGGGLLLRARRTTRMAQ